eukprot:superscaffoldBa00000709_g6700
MISPSDSPPLLYSLHFSIEQCECTEMLLTPLASSGMCSRESERFMPSSTPIITKYFERLVLAHLKSSLPPTLDPHQFAYRLNRGPTNPSGWPFPVEGAYSPCPRDPASLPGMWVTKRAVGVSGYEGSPGQDREE